MAHLLITYRTEKIKMTIQHWQRGHLSRESY